MIDLTLERPGGYHHVRAVDVDGVRIGDALYAGSLILTPDQVLDNWSPRSMAELHFSHLEILFALEPEVALLGTGPRQQLLSRELMIQVYERGIGLEVMTTDAACRTYNILAADGRRVAAALLPMSPG